MKRTTVMKKSEIKIQRRLELVRTTIRELTPTQLRRVNGGDEESGGLVTYECPTRTCLGCCEYTEAD